MAETPKRQSMGSVDKAWLEMDRETNLMIINGVMLFDGKVDYAVLRDTFERADGGPVSALSPASGRVIGRVGTASIGRMIPISTFVPTSAHRLAGAGYDRDLAKPDQRSDEQWHRSVQAALARLSDRQL